MYQLHRRPPHAVSPPTADATIADPTAQRILIVEDSDCLRAVAMSTLSAQGYAVTQARHGEDALRVIERTAEPFDLVVTELTMPVMSGYKLGRHLARQRPGLPVLYIMSAGVRKTLDCSGSPLGRSQVLQKPFSPEDLVRQVTGSLQPQV